MRLISLILFITLSMSSFIYSQERHPFGTYCPSRERGWYGEKRPVITEKEAADLIKDYFRDRSIIIGKIKRKRHFFRVEILNKDHELIDIIVIDRRTGRMRSIYY